ncbi:uncharacterized protein LOC144666421 [Oculina patagonica]
MAFSGVATLIALFYQITTVQSLSDGQFYQSVCTSCFQSKGRVIYHQTMTPSWLEAHASYIDSFRTATAEQLTFNAGSVTGAALLKVPMIPAGVLRHSTPLTIEITVANDVSIGNTADSDIRYGLSDGTKFIGIQVPDKLNYVDNAPCFGVEGIPGTTLTSVSYISKSSPRPSDSFYPGQFFFTLKLDERWGSCYTAHDGGYVKTAGYNNRLMLNNGLTLEVYKDEIPEKVGIKYIKVTIIQDD